MAWPFDREEQLDEWVETYLSAHESQATTETQLEAAGLASEPAYSLFLDGNQHAEAIWCFILKVVARRPPDWTLGTLAAGPLEDLIAVCGLDFIERIEIEARRDPIFRKTLHGVWQSTTSEALWARVERIRGAYSPPAA